MQKKNCFYQFLVLGDLAINVKSDIIMEKHDGFHFFNVTKVHVKFSIGGLKLHMGNLFDGIKALGKRNSPQN